MGEGVEVKLSADISDIQAKADQIPGIMDRAARKSRAGKPWEGTGPEGSRSDYGKLVNMSKEIEAQQEANRKAELERYKDSLRWNSKLQEDQDKAAAESISAQEKKQAKEDSQTEAWHRSELSRKLGDIREQKDAEERAAKEEEARRERERKQANADYLRRLKWNSRLQEDQDKAAHQSAKAAEWMSQFGKSLEGMLMSSIGPAALAAKAIQVGWGTVISNVEDVFMTRGLKISAGISPESARAAEVFSGLGTASDSEAVGMLQNAQAQVNKIVAGGSGANSMGFGYFGLTDYERYRKEGLNIAEVTTAMAKKFKEEGGSEQYNAAATSIFGANWRSLGIIQAEAYADKIGKSSYKFAHIRKPGDVMSDIESIGPDKTLQRIRAAQLKQAMIDALTPGELMGGLGGGPRQILNNVTSLQAMGGGDILSAIARGPQERTATAAEQTAKNTADMANALTNGGYVGKFSPPAKLGR